MMTDIQKKNARSRLLLGILNVGVWVLASVAGLVWFGSSGASAISLPDLLKGMLGVLAVQSLFDWVGGTILLPATPSGPRRFLKTWARGVAAHSLLLCSVGVLSLWSFRLSGGFCLSVAAASLCLFFFRRHILSLVSGARVHASTSGGAEYWSATSADPSFTGGTCGIGRAARSLVPESWKTQLTPHQFETVMQRRLWEIGNHLPARAFLLSLCWNLAGCRAGSLILELPARTAESALLLQCCWMTLWGFGGLLLLPSLSRGSVFEADRALAARGLDAKGWIQKFPEITSEDGNAKTLMQRIFYPIPSSEERLRQLGDASPSQNLGNVARVNLFLSLATLTILGRCVHCNVGRPELWVFPPSD